jgi:hypothetical protein
MNTDGMTRAEVLQALTQIHEANQPPPSPADFREGEIVERREYHHSLGMAWEPVRFLNMSKTCSGHAVVRLLGGTSCGAWMKTVPLANLRRLIDG